ncbi:MAG: hypothetical protein PHR14_07290 [Oscillospiraceae bacterium]|nr:hypothetical protein [Oscillospiraceae bacterium]
MSRIKSKIESVITLSPSTCYYMRTGQCSLDVVTDYFIPTSSRTGAGELLFCPRLYRAMCNRERMKPITVTPCECGHAEVVSGHQRACIASRKGIELAIRPSSGKHKSNCSICGGQVTFERNSGSHKFVGVKVCAQETEDT